MTPCPPPPRIYPRREAIRPQAGRNALAEENMGLPWFVVRRYFPLVRGADAEVLASIGMETLLRCAELYDEACGVKFSVYFVKAAIRHMARERHKVMALRSQTRTLDSIDERDGSHPTTLPDVPKDEGIAPAIISAIESLDPRTQTIIRARVLWGATYREIGRTLGLTDSRVQQIAKAALARLRELLPEFDPSLT